MKWRLLFVPLDACIFYPETRFTHAAPMRHPFGVEKLETDIKRAHRAVLADVAHQLVAQEVRTALKRVCRVVRIRNRRVLHVLIWSVVEGHGASVEHPLD